MDVKILGRIRKTLEAIDGGAAGGDENQQLNLTTQLELLVAQGAAPYREIVRVGRAAYVGTAAALPAVVAIPTTAVMLAIYNGAPDGGRSIVIDSVAASMVAKTAAAGQGQLLGLLGQLREAAPAAAALSIKKANGLGTVAGAVDTVAIPVIAALPAGTGIAANWFPLGAAVGFPGAAATPGGGLYVPLDGRYIVAPGRYFAMHVLADVVGSTFLGFINWHDAQLVLG